MDYPKVLIIGETFRLNAGGGITMTNLFKDWPGEKVLVITDRIDETNKNTPYTYYQLGDDELKFPFPFRLVQKKIKSGDFRFTDAQLNCERANEVSNTAGYIKKRMRHLAEKILKYSGLISYFYKIRLSDKLKSRILKFDPDIVYIQPFLLKVMKFGNLLYRELGIKYAVHIMDDSVCFINQSIILRERSQIMIENEYRNLIANATVHLCISESMAAEYESRYGKKFLTFRNPVEIEKWRPYQKSNLAIKGDELKIIYTGRLFSPTYFSILDLCQVVDKFNRRGIKVTLDLFTYDENRAFIDSIKNLNGIHLKSPVKVTDIPPLIQQYEVFYLCLDFDDYAKKYSRFSVSTRTSEGMISGVPILMYGPHSSAMCKFFLASRSAYIVGERSLDMLEAALTEMWQNKDMREELSANAISYVCQHNDAPVVREQFRQALLTSTLH